MDFGFYVRVALKNIFGKKNTKENNKKKFVKHIKKATQTKQTTVINQRKKTPQRKRQTTL